MPNPKIAVPLLEPLEDHDTQESLLAALRVGVARDEEANRELEQARTELESWLKAGHKAELKWPLMIELSGLSRGMLSRIFNNETPPVKGATLNEVQAGIRSSAERFWTAKQHRDQTRAERNERIRRAYMGDAPISNLALTVGDSAAQIYNVLHGRGSKLLKK